jgi:hypothetical protein
MRQLWRNNGLSLATFAFFFLFLLGQSVAGWMTYSEDQEEHGERAPGYVAYLVSPHFVEATSENWESEFLQMGMFVLFTVWLHQKGAAESKKIGEKEEVDREPGTGDVERNKMPAPVRMGGLALTLYSHSLSIALLSLFVLSFAAHVWSGAIIHSKEELQHGGEAISALGYLTTPRLWFESFQNWQSEFLAVFSLTVLGIFLREKGSPESKPVDAPHSQTGESSGKKEEEPQKAAA